MNWHLFEVSLFAIIIAGLTGFFYCQRENEYKSYYNKSKEPSTLKEQLKLVVAFRVKHHRYSSIGRYDFLSGSRAAFLRHYSFNRSSKERIIGAAILHPSGVLYAALSPARHHHVIRFMDYLGVAGIKNTRKQGFLTSCGRFVDRKTGLYLATVGKQIVTKHPSYRELYTEDMW
jgi:hypothetical protein